MIASPTVVLFPLNSPQAALRAYESLADGGTFAASWRECARRLRAAAALAHPAFRAKYLSRAIDCDARAQRLEVRS